MRHWMISSLLLASACVPAWGSHAYALWGEPRYAEGFSHFDYVNAKAPKGGELRLVSNLRISTDRKSTRLNSSHLVISYAVFCLKKKKMSLHGRLKVQQKVPSRICQYNIDK